MQRNVQGLLNPPAGSHPWSRTEHPRWTSIRIPYQHKTPWESCGFQRKMCLHLKEIRLKNTFSSLNRISRRESPHYLTQLVFWQHLSFEPNLRCRRCGWQDLNGTSYTQRSWFTSLKNGSVSWKSYQRLKFPDVYRPRTSCKVRDLTHLCRRMARCIWCCCLLEG